MIRLLPLWLIMWFLTWPALLAETQSLYTRSDPRCKYRDNLGIVMLFAALPPMWILTPFVTGFYEYGFQVFPTPKDDRSRC